MGWVEVPEMGEGRVGIVMEKALEMIMIWAFIHLTLDHTSLFYGSGGASQFPPFLQGLSGIVSFYKHVLPKNWLKKSIFCTFNVS